MSRIKANRMDLTYMRYQDEFEKKALDVLRSGWYILGHELSSFEEEWASYIGTKYCVGLASGLDALWISFRLLGVGEGDEVIVCANAYIACVMGITMNGATPVFVEPDGYDNIDASLIEEKITPKTKAILAVHLYGQCCDMDTIMDIAKRHGLRVVEDCAQSHGNHFNGRRAGTFGDVACFSFYPSKGCGAFGDGGAIVTNDSDLRDRFRTFRNYGSEKRYHFKVVGANSRLDELQAGLLSVKLKHLDELNAERAEIADRYTKGIHHPDITLPRVRPGADSTWHQYVIHTSRRDELMNYLAEKDIDTLIHYPIPPHLSEAYSYLGHKKGDFPVAERYADEVLSLPMYNGMTKEDQQYVIDMINAF
ncbi:MAG: DegT/DnrJ/EryC1/StrS family aminotransferase [Lachnospiraceae bacterium]|nr:DegT/DnrJ/EryC1/StrS family aminotransferase [Lachnospiraceae bacterium]